MKLNGFISILCCLIFTLQLKAQLEVKAGATYGGVIAPVNGREGGKYLPGYTAGIQFQKNFKEDGKLKYYASAEYTLNRTYFYAIQDGDTIVDINNSDINAYFISVVEGSIKTSFINIPLGLRYQLTPKSDIQLGIAPTFLIQGRSSGFVENSFFTTSSAGDTLTIPPTTLSPDLYVIPFDENDKLQKVNLQIDFGGSYAIANDLRLGIYMRYGIRSFYTHREQFKLFYPMVYLYKGF